MSFTISARWRTAELQRYLDHLSPKRLGQSLSKAVNDTAKQVERQAERIVAKTLSIEAKRAKLGIYIRPFSTTASLTATINGSASEIPLKAFGARETRKGVTARIWGQRHIYYDGFIKGGRFPDRKDIGMGGHVFHRTGTARLPIAKAPGASIAEAMNKGAAQQAIEKHADERLTANVLRQLDRASARGRGRF